MTVSIIIAVKTWAANLEECVRKCRELDYPDFEIIVLPDVKDNFPVLDKVSVIPTGPVNPAKKRDIAIGHAKGEVLAFIDDDAWPRNDWLKNAVENFKDDFIAAVGGPAVTAPDDNLRQRASGLVYSSILVSAKFVYRYVPKKRAEVDDFPTCNLLVRKCVLQDLGGFKTDFWPGEDTRLCLEITKGLGRKIIYDPRVLVYHHRRALFMPHIKQVANYALHRGYFVKRHPETSRRPAYFIPSLFLIALLLGGIFSLFSAYLRGIYFLGLSLYLLLVFAFSISKDLILASLVSLGAISTHIAYGAYFLKGLFLKQLPEEGNKG